MMAWETVIGLEVHVQLATASKLLSSTPTTFGAAPNEHANHFDLALPGTLPVVNAEAVRCAVLFGLAVDAELARRSVFARKHYFYPDLPKGYQTSQYEQPIVGRGTLCVSLPDGREKIVGITRAHLEEDAGKSLHDRFAGQTALDFNRAGVPLLEIVSDPDMRSAAEAVAYLRSLHEIVRRIGISDGRMAEGSMRCDVNISLREAGQLSLGKRAEIKNVNSFRFVEQAIEHETKRQRLLLESGETPRQETRLYDPGRNETRAMRSKEEVNDYRYFPDPDLLPVVLSEEYIESLRQALPELPAASRQRLREQHQLNPQIAAQLADDSATLRFFDAVADSCGHSTLAANWVTGALLAKLRHHGLDIAHSRVSATHLAELLRRLADGKMSSKMAKEVFAAMWEQQCDAGRIIEQQGLSQISDESELDTLIQQILAEHAAQVEQYRAAAPEKRKKMLGFFVGQLMRKSSGQANPSLANTLFLRRLEVN